VRNMKAGIRVVCTVLICAFPCSLVFAAKIKKRDGQVVVGTIKGLIVTKGNDATTNSVTYSVVKGGDIESIDENGVHLRAGSKSLYLLTRQKELANYGEVETEIVGVLISFFNGTAEDSPMVARIGVGGGVAGKYVDAKELTAKDFVLGTHKSEQGKDAIVPSLEIVTANGSVTIPVSEFVAFK